MHRLFLDANVLFSAAYKPDARVRQLWQLSNVILCSSRYALEDARINLTDDFQRQRLLELARDFQFFEPTGHELPSTIALPEKDAPILLAAIEARAHFLLTGDFRHFGRYFGRKVCGVTILPPARYLSIRLGEVT